jgi:hypothetical protein
MFMATPCHTLMPYTGKKLLINGTKLVKGLRGWPNLPLLYAMGAAISGSAWPVLTTRPVLVTLRML